jgi:energy-coupling factor transporter transmembrane protein EcfT
MWQRIQTVFLVIVIASLVTTIFLPIWGYQESSGKIHELYPLHYTVTENGVRTTVYFPYSVTAMLVFASLTLAIISIRKYKQRVVQMKLGALNSLFLAGVILSAVLFANQFIKTYQDGKYGLGLWLPGVAVIFNLIANRLIRRDERLVRDSERLR